MSWTPLPSGGHVIGHETLLSVHEHVAHAREKYPWPADMTDADKYRAAESELKEMAAAMLKGDARGIRKEALDCIAVLIRIVEGR